MATFTSGVDQESEISLSHMKDSQEVSQNRISGVKYVLVVLSAGGMVYDREALRQKILLSYPGSAVFFRNTMGKPIGLEAPQQVDLLIDLTGPGQRQGFFYALKLRRMARVSVGRNSGFFRKGSYDRVFDEKEVQASLPSESLERERTIQKKVLELAGISLIPTGTTPRDRGKSIALELPPMQHL